MAIQTLTYRCVYFRKVDVICEISFNAKYYKVFRESRADAQRVYRKSEATVLYQQRNHNSEAQHFQSVSIFSIMAEYLLAVVPIRAALGKWQGTPCSSPVQMMKSVQLSRVKLLRQSKLKGVKHGTARAS